ncbi:MAG: uroporphyrinogen decarboxylase [Gemmatimonadales bacterium]
MPEGRTLLERACRGERGERVPVWIMRQAGRYLPEYRKIRERVDFRTATKTPEIAARITLQPLERFELDAAILFSDIMTPLEGMGVELDFDPGPVLERPVRSAAELRVLEPDASVPHVLETVRRVREALPRDRALIGFAGAPFTLLCYLVQGHGSKDFMEARAFLRSEPDVAARMLDILATSMARYLTGQAAAGADVVMLFDSWVGLLDAAAYRRFVLPPTRRVVADVRAATGKPVVYFANGATNLLGEVREVGADVFGIDWTLPLSRAVEALGAQVVVQGNLDPAALFAPEAELDRSIRDVLREGSAARAHVFNLGHGIHHTTTPDRVAYLVDRVHELSALGEVALGR